MNNMQAIDIERIREDGKLAQIEYYACHRCITKILEGVNNGEA